MRRQILITVSIIFFLAIATVVVVFYARGYRFGFERGRPEFLGNGLLVATSIPDGASVFINDHLTTATDNTINLAPGEYKVKIAKEGYFTWEKTIVIQKEVVAKADATLFPSAPKLESITAIGVQNPTIDPSKTRLAYTVSSQSARKNGVYVLDMTSRPILTLQSASTQIADDTLDTFSLAQISWSPDGKQLIASITAQPKTSSYYLLDTGGLNNTPQDITTTLPAIQDAWKTDTLEKDTALLNTFKAPLKKVISENFAIIDLSLDETRILYQASASAELPVIITPRIIGANSTQEDRTLVKGAYYIYDIKEDKNYKLDVKPTTVESSDQNSVSLSWYPDSKHIIYVHDKKIDIVDYDGLNRTTVYAGPFIGNYVYAWPTGSKILILTNLGNPDISPNLYIIGLK